MAIVSLINGDSDLESNSTNLVSAISAPINLYLPESPANGATITIVDRDGLFSQYTCAIRSVNHKIINSTNNSLILDSDYCTIQLIFYAGLWSLFGTEAFVDLTGSTNSLQEIFSLASYNLKPNTYYLVSEVPTLNLPALAERGDKISLIIKTGGGTSVVLFENTSIISLNQFSNMAEFIFDGVSWQILNRSSSLSIANRPEIFTAMTAMNTL